MAAIWEQNNDIVDSLRRLVLQDDDDNLRTYKVHHFDTIVFAGDTIRIWKDGTYYELKCKRPRVQMTNPYEGWEEEDD